MNHSEQPHSVEAEDYVDREHDQEAAELVLDRKTLYHGSPKSGLTTLSSAEENTVGAGCYLVHRPDVAVGYAELRSHGIGNASPAVYEVQADRLRCANLCNRQMLESIMQGFGQVLKEMRQDAVTSRASWYMIAAYNRAIAAIENGVRVGHVKDATGAFGRTFSRYMQSLGYDGVKTLEGGEGSVSAHETYVIFDPSKLVVQSEQDLPPMQ